MRIARRILASLSRAQTRRAIACVAVTLALITTLGLWARARWTQQGEVAFVRLGMTNNSYVTFFDIPKAWYANVAWIDNSLFIGACNYPNTTSMHMPPSVERPLWFDIPPDVGGVSKAFDFDRELKLSQTTRRSPLFGIRNCSNVTWWGMLSPPTLGFGYRSDVYAKLVAIPCWLIAVFLACVDAVLLRRLLRSRTRPGLCPACSYDLRATPGRCPECGWEAASAAKESA